MKKSAAKRERIHCDANASYGTLAGLLDEVSQVMGTFGNPSAVHQDGQKARALMEQARGEVKKLINATSDDEVVFTSGATESNNMVVSTVAFNALENGTSDLPELICSSVEHPAMLEAVSAWGRRGFKVRQLPVTALRSGELSKEFLESLNNAGLVSLMAANNESGEIFPVASLFNQIRQENGSTLLHSDAVQLPGKSIFEWRELGSDMCSISAHKIGGFSGVGALVCRSDRKPAALLKGGPQEGRLRAGTENLIGIVGFGIAARRTRVELENRLAGMQKGRDFLLKELQQVPQLRVNFSQLKHCLPNTLSVTTPGVLADDLVVSLDLQGISVSSGAACASGKPEGSHVLAAYGLSTSEVRSTIRISITGEVSETQLERVVLCLKNSVARFKSVANRRC